MSGSCTNIMCIRDGKVFGIRSSTNGRSCATDECCGNYVKPNDLIRFSWTHVNVEEEDGPVSEGAMMSVKIMDGTETFTIGFLLRNYIKLKGDYLNLKYAQVIDLYYHSDNTMKRRKSELNAGVLSYRLLDNIQVNI